jgi:hypothetical protein
MRLVGPIAIAITTFIGCQSALNAQTSGTTDNQAIRVVLKVDQLVVTLAKDVHGKLRDKADEIVRHCGYDGGDFGEKEWRKALAKPSSIRLIYAKPIEVRLPRKKILVSQAVFSLRVGNFLGQPILYHNGRTTAVYKCDGLAMLKLMCIPQLKPHFPSGYQRSCRTIRKKK